MSERACESVSQRVRAALTERSEGVRCENENLETDVLTLGG